MFSVTKFILLRCFCNNYFARIAILSATVIVFLIVLSTSISERDSFIIPLENPYEFKQLNNDNNKSSSPHFPLVREFMTNSKISKFSNGNCRKLGFSLEFSKKTTSMNSTTKIIHLATTYFHKLNPSNYYFLLEGNATFLRYGCPDKNCYVEKSESSIYKADAVLFHVRDLEINRFPIYRTPSQIWILYSMEPPWLEIKDITRLNGYFNWTMSYRRNSTLLIKYGFIGERQKANKKYLVNLSSMMQQKINRAVWLVSNCNTDSNREEYVKRLMKIYPVDVGGDCGIELCRPAGSGKCYSEIASKYKFYLAFENAICQDYVTEKLFSPLDYNIVPITLGGTIYSRLTPNHSIINAMDFASPEDLGEYLWTVSMNDTLYLSYFTWKVKYRSYLQPWMCELCEKLHKPTSPSIIHDLDNWWNEEGSCMRWTESGFKKVEKYQLPMHRLKLFE